ELTLAVARVARVRIALGRLENPLPLVQPKRLRREPRAARERADREQRVVGPRGRPSLWIPAWLVHASERTACPWGRVKRRESRPLGRPSRKKSAATQSPGGLPSRFHRPLRA